MKPYRITSHFLELFYGGESLQFDHPSSYAFVCPHCGKLGFSETQLSEHVASDHSSVTTEVVSYTYVVFLFKKILH